ncbi:deoxynucleotide monophosphate kinase family protein [Pseudochelatococcus sp. B33]
MIIGLTGLAGSGKTTAAHRLIDVHGFTRHPMAGPLKAMLHSLGLDETHTDGPLKEVPCELLGGRTPRYAMQTLGTEWGRNTICPRLWIERWHATLPKGNVVVDDVRFGDEAAAVRAYGGIVVRIERPGLEAGAHVSERMDFDADHVIANGGPLAQLYHEIDRIAPPVPRYADQAHGGGGRLAGMRGAPRWQGNASRTYPWGFLGTFCADAPKSSPFVPAMFCAVFWSRMRK